MNSRTPNKNLAPTTHPELSADATLLRTTIQRVLDSRHARANIPDNGRMLTEMDQEELITYLADAIENEVLLRAYIQRVLDGQDVGDIRWVKNATATERILFAHTR